ncbi:hypothetical protein A2982_01920 [candidate division WWE3 bacterium RIFCSPLOWO2_01_FULL_39_13]|uniref:Sodium/calcium exchanger membrane region domain-containing protein n=1 Tax=candidate division WWE3 bacterium RIFCSPLOWO2_01_FULL_39_13 TaxID=1802624 RepID=A0A1F4V536_UNCKA|nr:MAG: hypothetical protein A2982_01920 [candidate division WWE3 bacterium RIFCSPLOWO2_01_FULL_39_13]
MLLAVEFAAGLLILIVGAHYLVEGAASIAKRFNISNLAIGLTVVAFGTTAPEFVVNLIAALQNKPMLSVGNVLGSNIANIFLVLGIAALVYPIKVKRHIVIKEIPFAILMTLIVAVLANDKFIDGRAVSHLTRTDGIVLIAFFLIFIYYTFSFARNKVSDENGVIELSKGRTAISLAAGLVGLAVGGQLVVSGAVSAISRFELSETTGGLLILAVGTSLPELTTAIIASLKHHPNLAIGNIIGSNLFNLLWILGINSMIRPIPFNMSTNYDFGVVIFANLVLLATCYFGRKRLEIERREGILYLFLYGLYVANLLINV